MFHNVGKKIKLLAKILSWLGIVSNAIFALFLFVKSGSMFGDQSIYIIGGMVVLVFGPLLSWAFGLVLYGFGQLVENSDKMVKGSGTKPSDRKGNAQFLQKEQECSCKADTDDGECVGSD